MVEHPILFTAPMVRAILDGRKTMTRRVVKPQPPAGHSFAGWCVHSTCSADEGKAVWCAGDHLDRLNQPHRVRCPYGQPGDRLWVRETWAVQRAEPCLPHERDWQELISPTIRYLADGATRQVQGDRSTGIGIYRGAVEKARPSIHMPRWAARITLEVTGVRVEQLQEITEQDAECEGVERWVVGDDGWRDYMLTPEEEAVAGVPPMTPKQSFKTLWNSINGAGSWSDNPWVWVVEFRRIEQEAKAA